MQKMQWGEDPELSGPRNWFRETLLIREVKKYKKKGTLLDFGCGSGGLIKRLSQNGYLCTGIDISKQAITYARSVNKTATFQVGDITSLTKIPDRSYDIVTSGEVLEHLKDDSKAVKQFGRILKKNGVCVISVPAQSKYWDINDDFSSHFRRYEVNELVKLFQDAGFRKVQGYYWGYPLSFFWHQKIYLPMIAEKMKKDTTFSGSSTLIGTLLKQESLKSLFSLPFFFDQAWNWTNKGGGIIFSATV